MLFYIAIYKDENTAYGVTVPAVAGCFSAGDTLEEAITNTKEAIQFHLESLLQDNEEPEYKHETLDELKANPDYDGALWVGVDFDVSQFTLKAERFNVSWPKYLIAQVDEHVLMTHDNRSNFLAKAAISAMAK